MVNDYDFLRSGYGDRDCPSGRPACIYGVCKNPCDGTCGMFIAKCMLIKTFCKILYVFLSAWKKFHYNFVSLKWFLGINADCNLRGLTPVCSCPRTHTGIH